MEGTPAQVGPCGYLLAHCRFIFAVDIGGSARTGLLGLESFYLRVDCALADTIVSFIRLKEHSNLETFCFVGMGLSVLVAFKPLINSVPAAAFIWIVAEGVSYITGAVFYSLNKTKYMHSVFHFFVLAGSVCHIIAVWDVLMAYL